MDRAASEAARAEGNAAFRKGRWSDAAAAYTRAIEADPSDAVPYANRAQVWLKLDKFAQAEADATRALERGGGVKVSYRRALARRAQGKLPSAAADLRAVLASEPNNAAAATELEEVEGEIRSGRDVADDEGEAGEAAEGKAAPGRAGAPAPIPAPAAKAKASVAPRAVDPAPVPKPTPEPRPTPAAPAPQRDTSLLDSSFGSSRARLSSIASTPAAPTSSPAPAPATPAPAPAQPSSFASLRQARTRPAYAGAAAPAPSSTSAPPLLATTAEMDAAAARATDFLRRPAKPATPPQAPRPQVAPPPDPTSTAPGAGLALLRALRSLSPAEGQAYLRHYAPGNIARITAPVLEPDSLGLILAALAAGPPSDAEWTRETLAKLRETPRWRMNVAMLSSGERAAGDRAWALAGGEGRL